MEWTANSKAKPGTRKVKESVEGQRSSEHHTRGKKTILKRELFYEGELYKTKLCKLFYIYCVVNIIAKN